MNRVKRYITAAERERRAKVRRCLARAWQVIRTYIAFAAGLAMLVTTPLVFYLADQARVRPSIGGEIFWLLIGVVLTVTSVKWKESRK